VYYFADADSKGEATSEGNDGSDFIDPHAYLTEVIANRQKALDILNARGFLHAHRWLLSERTEFGTYEEQNYQATVDFRAAIRSIEGEPEFRGRFDVLHSKRESKALLNLIGPFSEFLGDDQVFPTRYHLSKSKVKGEHTWTLQFPLGDSECEIDAVEFHNSTPFQYHITIHIDDQCVLHLEYETREWIHWYRNMGFDRAEDIKVFKYGPWIDLLVSHINEEKDIGLKIIENYRQNESAKDEYRRGKIALQQAAKIGTNIELGPHVENIGGQSDRELKLMPPKQVPLLHGVDILGKRDLQDVNELNRRVRKHRAIGELPVLAPIMLIVVVSIGFVILKANDVQVMDWFLEQIG
jgi:hypothetical protein